MKQRFARQDRARSRNVIVSCCAAALLLAAFTSTALAQRSTIASGAESQIAHGPAEIPPAWTLLAPSGTCIANPWAAGCPAPKQVAYPAADTLRQALQARLTGLAPTAGRAPTADGSGGAATEVSFPRTATDDANAAHVRAHAATGACTLSVYAPSIISVSGNYIAHGTSTIECPSGYVYAEVTSDLYQDGVFKANNTQADIFPPLYAAASASYDCNHTRTLLYANVGLSYVQLNNGSASGASGTRTALHTCPG